ncbi:MAG: molecular chaperone HtpG [Epsilonproteobacteria bacterium]|nr:molecular chaperone HtpG [Campylobacterota bacterium]
MAKYQYQTEVGELLHLMTHSLYSNKEIFLRELISNASDALDKFNYLHLTDDRFKDEKWEPKIVVKVDKDDGSVSVIDNGIGMNEKDLIENLGTIAKSGTRAFLEEISKNKDKKIDNNLIGQFGVGFYSVFMVSDQVEVITKKAGEDKAYKFKSDGKGEFEINEVIKESHGTVVYIKLRDDAKEFLDHNRVRDIIKKYSNHIPYKIYLSYKEEVDGKVEEKKEVANEATALWTLPKGEIKDEEYIEFYKTTWGDFEDPLFWIHTIAEGSLEYKTLFFIPKVPPADLYRADFQPGVKLYIKRVFITDKEKELLPLYLRFVRGIIDSEDLPLNVSREILQENRILANIKQASVKRILKEILKLDKEKFNIFINNYNRLMKEGIYTDHLNRELLLDIVRYKSTKVDGFTSFKEYIERESKKEDRAKEIYYIIGEDENILRNSPLLEYYKERDLEVLIMDDKEVDEIVTPTIGEYQEWKLVDITLREIEESKDKKEEIEKLNKEFKNLIDIFKEALKDRVKDVRMTTKLVESPSCVVPDSSDPLVSMRHLFKSMGEKEPDIPLILELNAKHPLIKKLNESSDKELIKESALILLDSARLAEGLDPTNKRDFSIKVIDILQRALS